MPPISQHEFQRRFYFCYKPSSLCRFLHKCKKPCRPSSEAIDRIPKRTGPFEEAGDGREYFWGILAVEKVSFIVVAYYHAVIFLGPFVFYFLWLFYWNHSGDMQNGSTPLAIVLGLLSLLWFPLIHK